MDVNRAGVNCHARARAKRARIDASHTRIDNAEIAVKGIILVRLRAVFRRRLVRFGADWRGVVVCLGWHYRQWKTCEVRNNLDRKRD